MQTSCITLWVVLTQNVRARKNGWHSETHHKPKHQPRWEIPCQRAQSTGNDLEEQVHEEWWPTTPVILQESKNIVSDQSTDAKEHQGQCRVVVFIANQVPFHNNCVGKHRSIVNPTVRAFGCLQIIFDVVTTKRFEISLAVVDQLRGGHWVKECHYFRVVSYVHFAFGIFQLTVSVLYRNAARQSQSSRCGDQWTEFKEANLKFLIKSGTSWFQWSNSGTRHQWFGFDAINNWLYAWKAHGKTAGNNTLIIIFWYKPYDPTSSRTRSKSMVRFELLWETLHSQTLAFRSDKQNRMTIQFRRCTHCITWMSTGCRLARHFIAQHENVSRHLRRQKNWSMVDY